MYVDRHKNIKNIKNEYINLQVVFSYFSHDFNLDSASSLSDFNFEGNKK